MSRSSTKWCFTWNWYQDSDIEGLNNLSKLSVKYICWGKELSRNKTPHLQGYVEFVDKVSLGRAKMILDPINKKDSRVHLEIAGAQNKEIQIKYCKKGEQTHEEWDEYKKVGSENGPNYGKNADFTERILVTVKQGERTDWAEARDYIKKNPDFAEFAEAYPMLAFKHPFAVEKLIGIYERNYIPEDDEDEINDIVLRPWQRALIHDLSEVPDRRKIIWYVDKVGGSGKSTLARYIECKHDAIILENGKTADLIRAYKKQRIIIFDLVRTDQEVLNYKIFESLKNGRGFSPKYDSTTKRWNKVHVVVMSNMWPKIGNLSRDRWDIRRIEDDKVFKIKLTDSVDQNVIDSGDAPFETEDQSKQGWDRELLVKFPEGNTGGLSPVIPKPSQPPFNPGKMEQN